MTDPRIAKLMAALRRRFPDKTLATGPMPDQPDSGEVSIDVLDVPDGMRRVVDEFASRRIEELWGEEPQTAFVFTVSPEATAYRYSHLVAPPRRRGVRASSARRRRPAKSRA